MEIERSENARSVPRRSKAVTRRKGRHVPTLLAEIEATERLIANLKEQKVEHFKSETLEIKFSQLAFLPKDVFEPKSEQQQEDIDELLYYSAPQRE